jgi:hypothetical protein
LPSGAPTVPIGPGGPPNTPPALPTSAVGKEQAPTIEYVSANEAPEEGIRVVNETTVSYTSVRFTIVPSQDESAPVDALKVDYDEPRVGFSQRWIEEGERWDLGPLGPGESRLLVARPAPVQGVCSWHWSTIWR